MKEVLEALANRILEQSAASNRLANAVERRENSDNLLRQELSETNHGLSDFRFEMRHEVGEINKKLAVLSKDVDDSSRFQVQAALVKDGKSNEDGKGGAIGLVNALGKLRPSTLILILTFLLIALASGWVKALL